MGKTERQQKIADVIRAKRIRSQAELVQELERRGVTSTQASVSRDLSELGVVKVGGVYKLPQVEPGQSSLVDRLAVDRAGDHLLVVSTGPGHAPIAALKIDKAKIAGIVGTIAGDDTIFVAVRGRKDQSKVTRKILSLFQRR
jgi:transcriptional regulator of arginine metabolism